MKRTKETIFREHPQWQERQGVSGLQKFDGEDEVEKNSMREINIKNNCRDSGFSSRWRRNSRGRHKRRQRNRHTINKHQNSIDIGEQDYRGMLQDNYHQRKKDVGISAKETNLTLANEKKDKEDQEKKNKLAEEQAEIDLLRLRNKRQPLK